MLSICLSIGVPGDAAEFGSVIFIIASAMTAIIALIAGAELLLFSRNVSDRVAALVALVVNLLFTVIQFGAWSALRF